MSNDTTPKTASDYLKLAAERGFEWLGIQPKNTKERCKWRCPYGHIFSGCYHNIGQGAGCNRCALDRASILYRKKPEDYHALAQACGISWIGPVVGRTNLPTGWACPLGHTWNATWNKVAKYRDCRVCRRKRVLESTRLTAGDYSALAHKLGIYWLGPSVAGNAQKTRWQCQHGHIFECTYNALSGQKGCPICSQPFRQGADYFEDLAKARGFTWLGPLPDKPRQKTQWQCAKGHIWQSVASNIKNGNGCPYCIDMIHGAFTSKPQRKLHEMLGGEMNYPVGRYNLDVALFYNDVKIDVEYDCWYWHQVKIEHDAKRNADLIEQGWRILRVKTNTHFPREHQIKAALNQLLSGETYVEIVLSDWGGS